MSRQMSYRRGQTVTVPERLRTPGVASTTTIEAVDTLKCVAYIRVAGNLWPVSFSELDKASGGAR